jgi:deazaflavin-dependent oxidoreductase (nitroreductase family)
LADWNSNIIEELRNNEGRVGGYFKGRPLLLLTVKGAKSGKSYTKPLAYTTDGDRFVIVASKGGSDENPQWYYNVKANPDVEIEIGTEKFAAHATEVLGSERDRLYAGQAKVHSSFNGYQAKTDRVIPVFVLKRD